MGDLVYISYYDYVLEVLYPPTMMAAKLSVLFQFERLFTRTQRDAFFYTVWTTVVLTALYYSITTFVFAFQCSPINKAWMAPEPGTCMNIFLLEAVQAGVNVLSDIAIVILPIWAILRLHTTLRRTFELIAVFSCGIL